MEGFEAINTGLKLHRQQSAVIVQGLSHINMAGFCSNRATVTRHSIFIQINFAIMYGSCCVWVEPVPIAKVTVSSMHHPYVREENY